MTTQTTATVPGTEISLYNQATWSRATVADGKWLQNETLEPISANDRILASAINYVSGGVDDLTYRIDLLEDASDVINVYGTWTDFVTHSGELFDSSAITNNDIIKVLNDPNQYPDLTAEGGHQTYFRWSADNGSIWPLDPTEGQWEYIGYIEPYYNKNEVDAIIDDLSATVKDEYVPWSATDCPIGDKNKANSYSLAQGSANSASYDSFAQGKRNEANGQSIAVGVNNYAKNQSQALGSTNSATSDGFAAGSNNSATLAASFAQGSTNYAYNSSFAQGTSNSALTQSFAQGKNNSANYDAFAQGLSAFANNESLAQGLEVTAKSKSFAQGSKTYADSNSFAQGNTATAKTAAFAQGSNVSASGHSFVQGYHATATDDAFAQGEYLSAGERSFAQGDEVSSFHNSLAQGYTAYAYDDSFAQGDYVSAKTIAFAQGRDASAYYHSFAQGNEVVASMESLAEGYKVTANNQSFAQGYNITATTTGFAQGDKCKANNIAFAQGQKASADGYSFAQGLKAYSNYVSFAEGQVVSADSISFAQGNDASAKSYSFVQGHMASATNMSMAQGHNGVVADKDSFAQGESVQAYTQAIAQGNDASAKDKSIAQGYNATATTGSFAQGSQVKADYYSISQGLNTSANNYSIAQGYNNSAFDFSQAFGKGTKLIHSGMAIGTYNSADNVPFVIGNGTGDDHRSDLFLIDRSGNVSAAGNVSASNFYINGNPIDSVVSAKFSAYNGDTKIAELPISAFKLQANTAKYISATSAANTMIFNVSDALINSANSGAAASAWIKASGDSIEGSAKSGAAASAWIKASGDSIAGSAQSGKTAYNILSSTKISAVGQGLSNTGFAYLSAGFRISAGDNLTIATAANNTIQLNSTPGINTYFSNVGYDSIDPTGTTGLITGISAQYNNDFDTHSHIINQSVVFGTTGGEQISGLLIQPASISQDNYVLTYSTADNSYTWKVGGIQQVYRDSNLSGNGTQDSLLGLNNVIKLSASEGQTTISNNGITIAGSQNNASILLNNINHGSTPVMTWNKGETSENIRIEDIQSWKAKPNISADKLIGPGTMSSLNCVSMEYVDILNGPKGLLFKDKNDTQVSAHVIPSATTGFLYCYGPDRAVAARTPTTGDATASSGCYWKGSANNINYVYLNDLNNQGQPLKLTMPAECVADIFYECNVITYKCTGANILFGLKRTSGQNEPADYIASSYINFPGPSYGGGEAGIGHQCCMLRVYNSNNQSFDMYPAFYKGYGGGSENDADYRIGSDKFVIRYYTL